MSAGTVDVPNQFVICGSAIPMIVMKFGGTSVQDADAIANVVQIVNTRLDRKPVVVISAIAQATNMLERAGRLAADGNAGEARDLVLKLIERHNTIVDTLVQDKHRHRELRTIISTSLAELDELVKGVSILRELTPRSIDALCSYGELLSSRIVAACLQQANIDAVWLDTKDFMVTDEHHGAASPMMDVLEQRLSEAAFPMLRDGKVIVTQGFIGVSPSGRRTTMGRESSDYSATIIGCAMNAESVEIWTDVDGILTADPRVVPAAKKVKVISPEEAFELSYFGAKVLHPNTMLPAIEKHIPVRILNSKNPQSSGTLISAQASLNGTVAKSVASKRNIVLLNVSPRNRLGQYIFWEHVYSVLTRHNALAHTTATSEYRIAIALDTAQNIPAIVHDVSAVANVDFVEGRGIVCVVGQNLRNSPHIVSTILNAVGNIGVSMISFGPSSSNLTIIVPDDAVPDAVKRVHAALFEERIDQEVFEELNGVEFLK
jgi:aspartate kinase